MALIIGEDIQLKKGRVMVTFSNIGEGVSGDYDPKYPEDVNLLRFDVYRDGVAVDDASYCTQTPAATNHKTLRRLLEVIMG